MPFCSGEVLIQLMHLLKLHLLNILEVSCSLVHEQQRWFLITVVAALKANQQLQNECVKLTNSL